MQLNAQKIILGCCKCPASGFIISKTARSRVTRQRRRLKLCRACSCCQMSHKSSLGCPVSQKDAAFWMFQKHSFTGLTLVKLKTKKQLRADKEKPASGTVFFTFIFFLKMDSGFQDRQINSVKTK